MLLLLAGGSEGLSGKENASWCSWITEAFWCTPGWLCWKKISTPETFSQSCIRLEWKVVWAVCVKTYPSFFPLKRSVLSLRKEMKAAPIVIASDFHCFRAKCSCAKVSYYSERTRWEKCLVSLKLKWALQGEQMGWALSNGAHTHCSCRVWDLLTNESPVKLP